MIELSMASTQEQENENELCETQYYKVYRMEKCHKTVPMKNVIENVISSRFLFAIVCTFIIYIFFRSGVQKFQLDFIGIEE